MLSNAPGILPLLSSLNLKIHSTISLFLSFYLYFSLFLSYSHTHLFYLCLFISLSLLHMNTHILFVSTGILFLPLFFKPIHILYLYPFSVCLSLYYLSISLFVHSSYSLKKHSCLPDFVYLEDKKSFYLMVM